jgi:hypothetical protein
MRVKTKAEIYRQSNEECARTILADPERYPAGSLMAIWAELVLNPVAERSRQEIGTPA